MSPLDDIWHCHQIIANTDIFNFLRESSLQYNTDGQYKAQVKW